MWKPEHLILWALGSTSPLALVHYSGEGMYLSFLLNFCPAVLKFVKKPLCYQRPLHSNRKTEFCSCTEIVSNVIFGKPLILYQLGIWFWGATLILSRALVWTGKKPASISRVTLTEDPCGCSAWTVLSKSKLCALCSYTSKGGAQDCWALVLPCHDSLCCRSCSSLKPAGALLLFAGGFPSPAAPSLSASDAI